MIVAEGRCTPSSMCSMRTLQWGRNLIVAEGYKECQRDFDAFLLQWGRNLIVAEGQRARAQLYLHRGFNGAAT